MSFITFGAPTAKPLQFPKLLSFGRSDVGVDMPRIWTPSAIASYLDQIRTELTALARDVRDAKKKGGNEIIGETELENIKDFYNEVDRWLASKPSTWWGANVTRAQDYEARIIQWRKYIAERGATVTSPEISPPIQPKLNVLPEDPSSKLIVGIVAVGGALLAANLLIGKFKGDAAPEHASHAGATT